MSASKQVYFSKGNLQYDSDNQKWQFATKQYTYIGNTVGNTSVTADGLADGNGIADLFGWVGASSTWTDLKQYGLTSSETTNSTDGYGNSTSENLKRDWGTLVGTDWRTLTKNEWEYLFGTRTGSKASKVGSTNDVRFAKATVNTDATSVCGVIIFPDGETFETTEFTVVGSLNTTTAAFTTTRCTSAEWNALEEKGCVFLPAAGYREVASVKSSGAYCGYWSSSPGESNVNSAICMRCSATKLDYSVNITRNIGLSIRLVKDVVVTP